MTSSAEYDPDRAVASQSVAVPPAVAAPRFEGDRRSARTDRQWITVFLVLAFALSWWPWPLAVLNPDSAAMVSFGPIIAAVVVTAIAGGRRRLAVLLRAVVRWRVPWISYVVALAGPLLIAGLVGALVLRFELVQSPSLGDAYGWSSWSSVLLLFVTTTLLGGPLFEEVGWRGFLLRQLQQRHSALVSTGLVAIVWSAWHLPLLISEPTGQRPPFPFLVWILAQTVILTWIYNTSSGSVLIAIGFHSAVNVSGRLLLEPFLGQDGFVAMWWLMAAGYALVAVVLLWRTRGRLAELPSTPRRPLRRRKREAIALSQAPLNPHQGAESPATRGGASMAAITQLPLPSRYWSPTSGGVQA